MFVNELWQGGVKALLDYDNTLFDNMIVPAGISLDDVVDNIILKYGNAPLAIPSPDIMKYYIAKWSSKRLAQWERFKVAIEKQYNPIENYNRTETSENSVEYGHNIKTDDDLTHGLNIKTDDDLTHGLSTENTISADNASTYQPDNKSTNSGKDERDFNEIHSGKDERDLNETHSGKDITKISNNISGNIGVTTSQQMLTAELDLIPRLNVIDYITDDFHNEFCLYVY